MSDDQVPIGRLIAHVVAVLAAVLVLSLVGLVALGAAGGDEGVRDTLTHVVETVVGVFIGIAAGRLGATAEPGER